MTKISQTAALLITLLPVTALASPGYHVDKGENAIYGHYLDDGKPDRVITITATDMSCDVKNIFVTNGDTVQFQFVNKGTQKREFAIGLSGDHIERLENFADAQDKPDVSTTNPFILDPAETRNVLWQFTQAGAFQFACNYVDQAASGVFGDLFVQ